MQADSLPSELQGSSIKVLDGIFFQYKAASKEWWLSGYRRAERSYSTFKVRRGGGEKIPLIQGKRNPSKTVDVARGHQRTDTLKP